MKILVDLGIINKVRYGLKILAKVNKSIIKGAETFKSKIKIEVSDASKTAI